MMVALSPTHCRTMTREQLEAHLTIMGWVPSGWGQGGATRADNVIYTTKTKFWPVGGTEPARRFNVHTIWNQEPDVIAKHALDAWFMSDDLFWAVAQACLDVDACDEHVLDPTNFMVRRCQKCHRLI